MKKSLCFVIMFVFSVFMPSLGEELVVGPFVLDNPLGATAVEKIGPDAWGCTWPDGVPYKQAEVELIVTSFSPNAVQTITESGGSVSDLALSTYMGLSGQPEQINKTLFMKGTEARTVYHSSIPRKHEAHVYTKKLDDGSFVMVGVRYFAPIDATNGELLRAIANTFRAAP